MKRINTIFNQHNPLNPRFIMGGMKKCCMGSKLSFVVAAVVLVAVFLASCEKPPEGKVPSITAAVDRDRISVGDKISYRVRALVDPSAPAVLKEHQGSIGPFTVLDADVRESVEGGKRIIDHRYTITSFSTGLHTVDPPVLAYGEDAKTELAASPIEIEVFSVLGETPELKDIKGPVSITAPSLLTYLLIGCAVAAGACVLLYFYIRGRKKREKEPQPERILSPHEMALKELAIIRAMGLIAKGMIKEYYTRTCDVLRRYVEGAFNISAPEMTTEEFLDAAAASGVLKLDHRALLRSFLNACDLVKFARYRATEEEAEGIYEAAKRFVEETTPVGINEDEGRETSDDGRRTSEHPVFSDR